jgi:uncharacterized protein
LTDTKQVVFATGIGLIAGFLSGLLGVGGGVIMVPLLVAIGLSQHKAHATSLAAIVLIASAAAVPFALEGRVSVAAAVLLAAGSLVGAPIGARLMAKTPEATLKIAFGIFMIAVSARFLWPT